MCFLFCFLSLSAHKFFYNVNTIRPNNYIMINKSNPITFFIVAGETSGDAHGASLMRAIKKVKPESRFVGHGGDGMTKEGLEIM